MISFKLDIEPVAKGRPRMTKFGHAFTPEKTRTFEKAVKLLAAKFKPAEPLDIPVVLQLKFHMRKPQKPKAVLPIVKPDLDNLVKAVKDALNGIMWTDDSVVVTLLAEKVYAPGSPFIEVAITTHQEMEYLNGKSVECPHTNACLIMNEGWVGGTA